MTFSISQLGAFARLAQLGYDEFGDIQTPGPLPTDWVYLPLPGFSPDLHGYVSFGLDVQVYAAFNDTTHQVAVVFRGTTSFEDFVADELIGAGLLKAVADDAQAFVDAAAAFASGHSAKLVTTGHSLGGALAEYFYKFDPHVSGGAAFGSPGTSLFTSSSFDSAFVHFTRTTDPVGNGTPLTAHKALNILVQDDNQIGESDPFVTHNIALDKFEADAVSGSPLGELLPLSHDLKLHFLRDAGGSYTGAAAIGFDAVFGGGAADNLNASTASSALWFEGGGGNDVVVGTDLRDLISGGVGADTLHGGEGDDSLWGGVGTDTIFGDGGDDHIEGGTANDTLVGGAGNDRYSIGVGQGLDTIDDRGTGADTLVLSTGSFGNTLSESWLHVVGPDLLVQIPDGAGGLAVNIRIANMGGAGSVETAEVRGGNGDVVTGTFSLADYWARQHPAATPPTPVNPTPSPPASGFNFDGGPGVDVFTGTAANDVARGFDGADLLAGSDGDDKLLGGGGSDHLIGGNNNDLLIDDDGAASRSDDILEGGAGDDSLVFYGAPTGAQDTGDGGSGTDLLFVDLRDDAGDWSLHLNTNTFEIDPDAAGNGGTISVTNVETIAVLFGAGDDFANGQTGQFYFNGAAGNDHLTGGDQADVLLGDIGNDILDGRRGADWIDGGAGTSDLAEIDLSNVATSITYLADQAATDTGFTFANGTHVQGVESITLVTGSGGDHLWLGTQVDDVITGAGDDTIVSSAQGENTVDGGAGDDTLIIDFSGSALRVGSSNDVGGRVQYFTGTSAAAAATRVTGLNIEHFVVTGTNLSDALDGSDGNDVLSGGLGRDNLQGAAGNDTLNGNDGNDILNAGTGVDILNGGAGVDNADINRSASTLSFFLDTFAAATAAGVVLADGTQARSVERWTASFGTGDDTIRTDLNGSSLYVMGGGKDLFVDDHRGSDVAVHSVYVSAALQFQIFDGADVVSSTNQSLVTGMESVQIFGGNAGDTLGGTDGDDLLDGGAGADALSGGLGNDAYVVDDLGDVVTEAAASGVDQVQSSVKYTLGANLENLTLTGTAAINAAGNALNNAIIGNDGNNNVNGGAGADKMSGQGGNDTYVVDNVGDSVIEQVNAGTDRVQASVTFTLGANIEQLTLTGNTAINATGNALNNTIVGNANNNLLNGGAGADSMSGGAGNDTYAVDSVGDVVTEATNSGVDQVQSAIKYTLGVNVENLRLTGSGAINGAGNALANVITGSTGNNVISGLGGNDTLNGGAGHDTLIGGAGADHFMFNVLNAAASDTISDFSAVDDDIRLDNAVFTALGTDGALASAAFFSSADGLAHDADDRIIYNTTTGQLLYDADGNGAGAAVLIATLAAHPAITVADIFVI